MQVSSCRICVDCHMCQSNFYQTTRRRPPWLDQTLQRPGFLYQTTQRQMPTRGEGFDSWAPPKGEWASATIHSLTTRLHGGGKRQPCCLFRFILLQRIERAMEVLLQDCTGSSARMLPNCTATYFSLSLYNQTPMTTTTTTTAAAAAAAAAATIFKYYHHSLITLSHPLRLKPLLLQTHATRSSSLPQPTETTFTSTEGNFFILLTVGNTTFSNLPPSFFKPTAIFQTYRGRGGRSRDPGSGGGNFTLEKIFTSPCLHLTGYYCWHMLYQNGEYQGH